jgi:3-oxoacyl-[acyl-carrier-protein] synthase-3
MAFITIPNVTIKAISACVPKNTESNYDYDWITPEERALLVKTTGIEKRRVASENICTSDMCFEAA